jgi:serine/threonine protein kinase
MLGQTIGQYRVLDCLGRGGMGTVYRATDETLQRDVALKILHPVFEDSSVRFRREAAALARLNHAGIAAIYELLEDGDQLVMVMEFVRGQTLQDLIDHVGPFSPQRAADVCMQVLAALEHAHSAGVVHRDLKPGNLMLTENGFIKIMDFGIARVDGSAHLTSAGAMMGTPAYMAPEQVLGHAIDARADLYAMGVIFYRLISAELPFRAETPFDMAQSQVNDPPTPIEQVRSNVPAWVGDIVTRALAKSPDQRFQSALEFHDALALGVASAARSASNPAVESTEKMERPEFQPRARTIPQPSGPERRSMTIWAGVTTVLLAAVGVWMRTRPEASHRATAPAPGPVSNPAPSAASPLDAATPAGGASVPAKRVVTKPGPVATVAASAPLREAQTATAVPLAVFRNVKLLAVDGSRTTARDVVLALSGAEMNAVSTETSEPLAMVQYDHIARATYVHARDPQWHPEYSAPAGRIDVPGILGRARHWLVLQTKGTYAILRLDGPDALEILKAVEDRTGRAIDRPLDTRK